MKQCKCEHWMICPVCKPSRFDADGNLLPPEPTPLEAARMRVHELEAELAEQCRINGMGSEREARLIARVEQLERAARMALSQMLKQAEEMPCHYDDYFEAITALRNVLGEVK